MATALDNWNPANKAACFRRFASELKEQSKAVFLQDGHHVELFFLVDNNGRGEVLPAPPNVDRDQMVAALKRQISEQNIYGVIHIVETWAYFRQKPRDHTLKQIMEGEIKVSELRPEDRDEALMVSMESREGARFMWMTPILRDGSKASLGSTLTFDEPPGGLFASLFEP